MVSHKYKLMWKTCGYFFNFHSQEFKNEKANPRDYRHKTRVRNVISNNFKVAVVKQILGYQAQGKERK